MIRILLTTALFISLAFSVQGQYLENFSSQNGKGLIDAVCPNGSTVVTQCGSNCSANNLANCTTVPPDLTGVTWTLAVPSAGSFFTDNSGTGFTDGDYFGVVSNRMEVTDPDQEICWVSPTLYIGSAGAVSISVNASESGSLDNEDFIRAQYSLNGGAWTQFGYAQNDFTSTTFTASGIVGTTLQIRICAFTNRGDESIYFDNVSVPQSGVTTSCSAPTLGIVTTQAGSCNSTNGTIKVTASGGAPGYNIAWNGPSSGNPAGIEIAASGGMYTITGLAAGAYTITVTDVAGCSATATASITTATALALGTQVQNTCSGVNNGAIDLTVSNGVQPYSYSWSNIPGSPDPQDQTNLAAGTYTVTVTDNTGCTASTSATVGTLSAPACSVTGPDYVCNNTAGNVYSAPAGMSAYSWGISAGGSIQGSTTGASVTVTSGSFLSDYTVSVTVTNANGCTSSCSKQSFIYLQKPPADITANPNPICLGAMLDLSVSAAASSTVSWTGEGITNASGNPSTTAIPTTTGPHVYSVMVTTNPAGCTNTGTVNVMVNARPNVTCPVNLTVCVDAAAFLLTDGNPAGGLHSGAGVSANIFNPAAAGLGPHTITYSYTDGNGCANSCTYTVTVLASPTIFSMTGGGSYCSGGPGVAVGLSGSQIDAQYDLYRDGNFVSTIFGTGNPISFGQQTTAGNYIVVAILNIICQKVMSGTAVVTVNNGSSLSLSTLVSDVSCFGYSNGYIDLTVSGGTPGYTYAWSNGPTTQDINGLFGDTYTVTVTDAGGCTKTIAAIINEPDPLYATGIKTNVSCNGASTGSIDLSVSGGTPGYSYSWSNLPGSPDPQGQSGLAAGTYTVTVTDFNGCTTTASTTITQPPALNLSTNVTNVLCAGASTGSIDLTVSGGIPSYSYAWSNGPTSQDISGITAGTYTVTVTDINGCAKTTSATVGTTNPLPVCTISDAMGVVCPNSTGNQYNASAGMDTYAWAITGNGAIPGSKSGQSVSVTAGASGTYTLTVTISKNGCTSSCDKTVDIAMQPFSIVYTPEYCAGDPGPMIGLNGSENGAMYQLQTGGGMNIGAPVLGNGAPINFGAFPNGNYKVVVTGGLCDAMLPVMVNATPVNCRIDVPDFCTCNSPGGYTPVTIKAIAPAGQNWEVVGVVGLYGPDPYPQITVGMPLNYIGGNMYTLDAYRDNTKGYFVKISNGYTEKDIQVGNPSW
ncbi:MAG: SprB repeat-containing protein [Lewinellaceae bacterium]|nr:SprB repeat-containing protein [Lewinellaceae bacterium]